MSKAPRPTEGFVVTWNETRPVNGASSLPSLFGEAQATSYRGEILSPEARVRNLDAESSSKTNNTVRNETLTVQISPTRELVPPVAPNFPNPGKRGLRAIASWEGVVEKVSLRGFTASLTRVGPEDVTNSEVTLAKFSFDDVSIPSDRAKVDVGAVFYWTVGKATNPAGSEMNSVLLRFRKLPAASKWLHERAMAEADQLLADLSSNES